MSHDRFSLYKGVIHVFYTYTPTLNYILNQFIQFFIRATFLQVTTKLLLDKGADVNVQRGEYGNVL